MPIKPSASRLLPWVISANQFEAAVWYVDISEGETGLTARVAILGFQWKIIQKGREKQDYISVCVEKTKDEWVRGEERERMRKTKDRNREIREESKTEWEGAIRRETERKANIRWICLQTFGWKITASHRRAQVTSYHFNKLRRMWLHS